MSLGLCKICFFLLDQIIDTIQSNTTIVADDTSSSVGIRKSGDDLIVTCFLHLRSIDVKHCLVVCFMIFGEDLMQFRARSISVSRTCLLSHLDTAVRHKRSLQRLVCLKSDDLLQVFHIFIDIARSVCSQSGYNFCLHIQNAAFRTFLFLKFLKFSPQLIGRLGRSYQEGFVSFVLCVVVLNEITHIDFLFPEFTFEVCPLFKLLHKNILLYECKYNEFNGYQLFS